MSNFDEYIKQGEPNKAEKAKVWKTAIGLQQVDGLKPSEYLIALAKLHIEGEITIKEVNKRIDSYYKQNREMHVHADTVKSENDTVNDTVFLLIKQNKDITASEISEQLNLSLSTAKRKIKALKEQKLIIRIGSNKAGYWKICE